jgi:cell surface protein SprA
LARLQHQQFWYVTILCVVFTFLLPVSDIYAQNDTAQVKGVDTLRFPIRDRIGDRFNYPINNPYSLPNPINITDSIAYDPETKLYHVYEKIGNKYYRTPTYFTFDEFLRLYGAQADKNYFQKRSNALSELNRKLLKPEMKVTDNLFNRIFGNGKVDLKPQGDINLIAGYQGQKVNNPALPERARRNGGFDFDMNAAISVVGSVGDKLKLPISYNTQSNFDFENQLRLEYTGDDDQIIKKIEAGNVSFSSKGSLIPGAQQLFGIKTQLQFGKLWVTGVLANQRSQRQSLNLQGGSASMYFDFKAHDYEENRHFLLSQYFKNNFNHAMSNLPVVNSQVQILRLEVWVTNRNNATTETRDVVALMDLGEQNPYLSSNPNLAPGTPLANGLPDNNVNQLYRNLVNDPSMRNSSMVTSRLGSLGLTPIQDFEKTFARKLNTNEYYYNPQVGFLSLMQALQPDEVLGVAFQYSYNGRVYQVGEFSQDVTPDTTASTAGTQKMLFLKLLKATSQRTQLPIWKLMMKNVYSLKSKDGSYLSNMQPNDFKLNVLYEEPSQGQKRFLPEGDKVGQPIISILNLDRLNARNDPSPDGVFDYIEGFTVISNQGRVIFPLLEPFGRDLDSLAFANSDQATKNKYIYYPLYDTIKEIAKTYANLDRYIISGYGKGNSNSDIYLGAFNIPQGSVSVTAGGQTLIENVDYTIDYSLGSVKILNQAILNSGVPVSVQFENNAGFGIQQRSFMGLRLDYMAIQSARENFSIGASMVKLRERPYFTKMLYDNDPINNTMYGLDFSYQSEVPRLTRWLNKLPFYSTEEMSTIQAYGEAAYLQPGHPKQIGEGSQGMIFIDDFEGSRNTIDLRFPLVSWGLSSTPANNGLFPEANLMNDLNYGKNRAKIAWYNIEPILQDRRSTNNPLRDNPPTIGLEQELNDPRTRSISVTQLYPNRTPDFGQAQLVTFDIAYYPQDRGPYNFDTDNIDANGKLLNPKDRWGGIMRGLDQVDFETGNVEFIEFWMQDPYIMNPGSTGGDLYFNLGNVSEDVLKDGKRFFENGISGATTKALEDSATVWGKVPGNPIQVTKAFSNDPADRPLQDAGLDGLDDDAERRRFQSYLASLAAKFGVNSPVYQAALNDPASDNFKNYRDQDYNNNKAGILERYKSINSPQGNSPVSTNENYVSAFTMYPDQEEFNNDNTLNELEEYFQYRVRLNRSQFQVGNNFITDSVNITPNSGIAETWYLFRIPIAEYEAKIGNIPDFKSIRFIRMYLTGFEDSVVLRFAKLELVRSQWRKFNYELDTTGQYLPLPANSTVTFNQLAVNIEENSARSPIPYKTPPGVIRQQQLSNNNVNMLLNEQSLSMQICDLPQNQSRGVFKNMNLDLRMYGKLQMYIHAESTRFSGDVKNDELYAVIRLGNDLINNFYEIKIPLKVTSWGSLDAALIWPAANELDLNLSLLTDLKMERNNLGNVNAYYKRVTDDGKEYAIIGNPNLGEVRSFFIGVENKRNAPACAEIWFNELRLSELNEKGGWAALARVDFKLADLGTLYIAGSARSSGFGTLEQRVNERSRENMRQFDAAANLELGKLLPANASMSIPVYASVSQQVITPEYDPYDLDIKYKDKLNASNPAFRDSIKRDAIEIKTIQTVNFTNVKKVNTTGKKIQLWSVENIDVSYSYYREQHTSPLIESNNMVRHRAGLGYNYTSTPRYWEPVKGVVRSNNPWLAFFREFNINPKPALIGFRADVNRQFGAFRPRSVGTPKGMIPETYDKFFTFDRYYNLRWDLTRSLNIDFKAINKAWIDEDTGRLDHIERKRMWDKFWDGGRTIAYDHDFNITYLVPINKIPAFDWMTVRASYTASFSWLGASLIARNLGNTLSNGQQKNLNAELDFTKLYAKSKWLGNLDKADAPAIQPPSGLISRPNAEPEPEKTVPDMTAGKRFLGRVITSLKRTTIQYSESASATIYGYTDSTKILGMNFRSMGPGLGFIFGKQPDTSFVTTMANKGWLSSDPDFNYQNRQDYSQRLNVTAQLSPFRDLIIDLNLDKAFGKNYTELYKDTTGTGLHFAKLSPYSAGSFSISYISYQTLFEKVNPNEVSNAFRRFQENRILLSRRLAEQNPYWQALPDNEKFLSDGFYNGYSRYAQDVLIPAFLAAYTNKDPNSIELIEQRNPNIRSNPFKGLLPKPNWNITYTGLTTIPAIAKVFTNFTISHGYRSTLSMNSFNSNLLFDDPFRFNYPGFIDTLTGNFMPYFLVPNISISEAFEPLINIDVQFTNQLQSRFEYRKSRQLSLSLIDYQLSEAYSQEFTIGAGFRKKGALSFLKWKGKSLENDGNFRLDLSFRDDVTTNSRLDQEQVLPTNGQKVIFINPSIDYVVSKRVNLKLYFEQRRTIPKISTSPPMTTTKGGVQIRVSLAQ